VDYAAQAQPVAVRELDFGQSVVPAGPHRRAVTRACAIAIAVHVAALLLIVGYQRFHRVHVVVDLQQHGIGAFVIPAAQPTGTTGVKPVVKKPELVTKPARPAPRAVEPAVSDQPESAEGSGQAASLAGSQAGPVRLVSGVTAHLLKKVVPVYPAMMRSAAINGTVVLDAIIHSDGTIGDITVLDSSGPAFEQAAVAAVKQWQYTPIPYEGIVTVTLNFTMRH
jgi:TonB family protein